MSTISALATLFTVLPDEMIDKVIYHHAQHPATLEMYQRDLAHANTHDGIDSFMIDSLVNSVITNLVVADTHISSNLPMMNESLSSGTVTYVLQRMMDHPNAKKYDLQSPDRLLEMIHAHPMITVVFSHACGLKDIHDEYKNGLQEIINQLEPIHRLIRLQHLLRSRYGLPT